MEKYIAAIDQGTTSTRCILFDKKGKIISQDQREHEQIFPKPGWVEHNANEIWRRTQEVLLAVMQKTGFDAQQIAAVGITNQRETTLLWEKSTGKPVYPAIVWQDTRTDEICQQLEKKYTVRIIFEKLLVYLWQPIFPVQKLNGFWTISQEFGKKQESGKYCLGISIPG